MNRTRKRTITAIGSGYQSGFINYRIAKVDQGVPPCNGNAELCRDKNRAALWYISRRGRRSGRFFYIKEHGNACSDELPRKFLDKFNCNEPRYLAVSLFDRFIDQKPRTKVEEVGQRMGKGNLATLYIWQAISASPRVRTKLDKDNGLETCSKDRINVSMNRHRWRGCKNSSLN